MTKSAASATTATTRAFINETTEIAFVDPGVGDLAATLAGLLGLRPPQRLDGNDLGPLLAPQQGSPR
jgi:hypothetical protein